MPEQIGENARPYLFRCGTPPQPGERLWVGDRECVMDTDGQPVSVTPARVKPSLADRFINRLFCTACLRLRCSPGHLLLCGQPASPSTSVTDDTETDHA